MNENFLSKPTLSYRYEFGPDEAEAAQRCVETHGFAVLKNLLCAAQVAELQESVQQVVNPKQDLGPGQSRTHLSFIEESPALWKLLDDERFMRAQQVFCQADELTINRSAAIIRNPGSQALVWHSDWRGGR